MSQTPSTIPSPDATQAIQPQNQASDSNLQMALNQARLAQMPSGVATPFGVGQSIPFVVPFAMQAQQSVRLWQGQYPPPEAVEHYEKILPGAFNRIMSMAEQLQQAQIKEAERVQNYMHADAKRGQWLGFITTLLAMTGAVACLWLGYPWVAAALVGVPVMAVAKSLIESAKREKSSEIIHAGNSASVSPAADETPS